MKIKEVAAQIGCSPAHLYLVVSGGANFGVKFAKRAAEITGTDPMTWIAAVGPMVRQRAVDALIPPTQAQVARMAGLSIGYVNHILHGREKCGAMAAYKLSQVTGIEMEVWLNATPQEIQERWDSLRASDLIQITSATVIRDAEKLR